MQETIPGARSPLLFQTDTPFAHEAACEWASRANFPFQPLRITGFPRERIRSWANCVELLRRQEGFPGKPSIPVRLPEHDPDWLSKLLDREPFLAVIMPLTWATSARHDPRLGALISLPRRFGGPAPLGMSCLALYEPNPEPALAWSWRSLIGLLADLQPRIPSS